jgi:hypothetical protein
MIFAFVRQCIIYPCCNILLYNPISVSFSAVNYIIPQPFFGHIYYQVCIGIFQICILSVFSLGNYAKLSPYDRPHNRKFVLITGIPALHQYNKEWGEVLPNLLQNVPTCPGASHDL